MDKIKKPLEERNVLLSHKNQQQERNERNCLKETLLLLLKNQK